MLIGIVDANQVIVSSKIMGRVEKLYVDEGSKVKAGDLIAEIDSAELEAQKDAARPPSTPTTRRCLRCTPPSADAGRNQQRRGECASAAGGGEGGAGAAKADLARIQSDSQRMIELAKAGVESDQDRVRAEEQLNAQKAVVVSAQKNVMRRRRISIRPRRGCISSAPPPAMSR